MNEVTETKPYVPYGEEWKNAMMKLPKKKIIELWQEREIKRSECKKP